jgi:two-component sensor histidine kinase
MDREELAIILDTLARQAQRTLQQLDEEPTETTQARIRVMMLTMRDLQNEAGL